MALNNLLQAMLANLNFWVVAGSIVAGFWLVVVNSMTWWRMFYMWFALSVLNIFDLFARLDNLAQVDVSIVDLQAQAYINVLASGIVLASVALIHSLAYARIGSLYLWLARRTERLADNLVELTAALQERAKDDLADNPSVFAQLIDELNLEGAHVPKKTADS